MYNGIGLQTPRGSGTNGYIQTSKFFVKPKTNKVMVTDNKGFGAGQGMAGLTRKPNKDILEHDRKRQIQLKLVVLEDKLIDQGYTDAEIAEKLEEARRTLEVSVASEEAGGPTAIVVEDKKVSDTQTHQIAARKEKQLDTLRAALGIGSEPYYKKQQSDTFEEEEEDDKVGNTVKDGAINDSALHNKDIGGKKGATRKGVKNKKESGRDVFDESKHHGKKESKRIGEGDSSDADSSGKSLKKIRKEHQTSNRESDFDYDTDIDGKKNMPKSPRKDKKSRRHQSDTSESDVDSNCDGRYKRGHKRHDSDDDNSGSDGRSSDRTQKVRLLSKRSGRHDSEVKSDTDGGEDRGKELEREKNQHSGSYSSKERINHERHGKVHRRYHVKSESDYDKVIKGKKGKGKHSKRRDTDDSDYTIEKRRRGRRHDSEEDSSDPSTSNDSRERIIEIDSGSDISDYRREKIDSIKPLGKNHRGHRDDLNGRGGTCLAEKGPAVDNVVEIKEKHGHHSNDNTLDALKKLEALYQPKKDNLDGYGDAGRAMMKGESKDDSRNLDLQPEAKSRSRNSRKVEEYSGEPKKDVKIEYETNSHSYKSKDDGRRHENSRLDNFRRGRESENLRHRGRTLNRGELHNESRRNSLNYEEYGWSKRESRDEESKRQRRDEEDYWGRKHGRVEEEIDRKLEKYEEHHRGRYGREQKEEHGSRKHKMDSQVGSSKRARYDDFRSSERQRHDRSKYDGQSRSRD